PGHVGASIAYTDQDARKDLKRLGYEPKKIDQMMLLQKQELSMRHVQQPYFEGDISLQEMLEFQQDSGFDLGDLNKIVPFYQRKHAEQQARDAGSPQVSSLVSGLAAGDYLSADLVNEMQ